MAKIRELLFSLLLHMYGYAGRVIRLVPAFGFAAALAQFVSLPCVCAQSAHELFRVEPTYQSNLAFGTIATYESDSSCGAFHSGQSAGLSILVQTSLSIGSLKFQPGLRFQNQSTDFRTTPTNTIRTRLPDNSLEILSRKRTFFSKIQSLSLLFPVSVELSHVSFQIGPEVGVNIAQSVSEVEQILSPQNAVYDPLLGSKSSRPIPRGGFSSSPLFFGFSTAVSYKVLIPGGISISPTVRLSQPIKTFKAGSSSSWQQFSLGAGIGIGFSGAAEAMPPPAIAARREPSRPTAPTAKGPFAEGSTPEGPKRKHVLEMSVKVYGIGANGESVAEPILSVERRKILEAYPLLNYVFFDDSKSEFPARYLVDSLPAIDRNFSNALDVHHALLDIIGSRMRALPTAAISLTGGINPRSESHPAPELGLARAEQIKNYLIQRWSISSERITILPNRRPTIPSDESTASGRQENRRVEILSLEPELLAPVWSERIESVATPPQLSFEPQIVTSEGIKSLTITITQRGKILQQIDALSEGAASDRLWTLNEASMPTRRDSLDFLVVATDSLGETATQHGSIHLKQELRESEGYRSDTLDLKSVERFSLILFDYNSAEVEQRQVASILDAIKPRLNDRTHILITGHTDRTGNPEYNEQLSDQRAKKVEASVRKYIDANHIHGVDISTEHHGGRDILFDNNLPEGRFLSRTVRVVIQHDL